MTAVHVRVRVGGEHYALPIDSVTEVAEFADVTPVPGAGDCVLGVRNLRGQVLPVASMASVLGLPDGDAPSRLVIVESANGRAGLAVDELVDVGPLPAMTEATGSRYLGGAALVDGELVAAVDVAAVLGAVRAEEQR